MTKMEEVAAIVNEFNSIPETIRHQAEISAVYEKRIQALVCNLSLLPKVSKRLAAVNNINKTMVFEAICKHNGITLKQLAIVLDSNTAAIYHHITSLRKCKSIFYKSQGRSTIHVYYAQ